MCTIQRGAHLSAQHLRSAATPFHALRLARLSRPPPTQASEPCRATAASPPNWVTTRRRMTECSAA